MMRYGSWPRSLSSPVACLSILVGVLTLAVPGSALADELIGTYRVYYRANGSGCGSSAPNPFRCNYLAGPIPVDATPGNYKIVVLRQLDQDNLVGGFRIWSGDENTGTQFHPDTPTFYHAFGRIYLYFHDWYVWDNPPLAGVEAALYRVTPVVTPGLDLYDDFSLQQIDPEKWKADQLPNANGGAGLELIRHVADGMLQLQHRVVAGNTDSRRTQTSANQLIFTTPYTEVKFAVTVMKAEANGCSVARSQPANIQARSWSRLFNDGTNNVSATIFIAGSSSGSSLRAGGSLSGGRYFAAVDLGPVALGSTVILHMRWDKVSHRVEFQKDDDAVQSLNYTLSDSAPPTVPFSAIEVAGLIGNCAVGGRPFGEMIAFIDDVQIGH